MHTGNDHDDRRLTQSEVAARAAFELCAGRPVTDAEWATAQSRLLQFAGILRDWERKTASRRGNLEELCQREP